MMALPCAEEFWVAAKEVDDVFVTGTRVSGKGLEVAACKGTHPGPGSPESMGESRDCSFNGEVAAEQGTGERVQER
jgi:hypothetical protein